MLGNKWSDIYKIKFNFTTGAYKSKILQTICCFDIETSNGWRQPDGKVIGFDHQLYKSDEEYRNKIDNLGSPVSCLYVWQMAIEDKKDIKVFMGRTWDEFDEFLNMLTTEVRRQAFYGKKCIDRMTENAYAMKMQKSVTMFLEVHNLGFEFQHLRNLYEVDFSDANASVFARQSRKPMKAVMHMNKVKLEWRDTYVLTCKSLKNWCKDEKLPVQKLEEPKDYYLVMRTPQTELTDEEINYSINDVVSMVYGIQKYRDKYESLKSIPLTQTGEVRRRCVETIAIPNPDWAKHCHDVTVNYSPAEFKRLVHLFQGGWTHANKMYVGETVKDVKCFDFASSYPFCMVSMTYPIGQFEECDVNEFKTLESQDLYNPDYHWYMKIELHDVVSRLDNSYWSLSKVAFDEDDPISMQIVDNGRIFSCDHLIAYMTDLDWATFKKAYKFKNAKVKSLYKSKSDYLPKEMIETILDYFQYKTSLKGVPDSETLYNTSKQFINSIYGVAVTRVITDIVSFDRNGWTSTDPDDQTFEEMLHQTSEERAFTLYQAGIWVTSWARYNLWTFITELDEHICYCDTDSIKGCFDDNDLKFVEDYNKHVEELENRVAKHLGIDPAKYTAQTSKGKTKRIGHMERESDCQEFRTLGAKRYVDLVDGEIECTIAGLPKSAAKAKIKSVDDFNDGLFWETDESEKLIARYEDNQKPCDWTDRDGNVYHSTAKYGICLQPTTFDLSISEEFSHFLTMLRTGIIDRSDPFYDQTPAWFFE